MNRFATSDAFFQCSEPLFHPEVSRFDSIKGRIQVLKNLLKRVAMIPLALVVKLCRTSCSVLGVIVSLAFLTVTLFTVPKAREYFVKRVLILANDLADWVLWPFAVLYCLVKLILAASIHPSIYYHC